MAKNSFSQFPGRFAVLLEENIVKTSSPPKKYTLKTPFCHYSIGLIDIFFRILGPLRKPG